jgi:hypothetical protein
MTSTQKQAIWELYRQGLQEAAARAEQSWDDGERFEPEPQLPLTRRIALLVDCANWELRTKAESQWPALASNLPSAAQAPSRRG